MKKKMVTLGLASALAATTLIGGTMAYFTDTATATNTFTYGKVAIELVEKGEDGVDFDSEDYDKTLRPGSKTVNQVVKKVTVKNTGTEDAYMWIEVWIPSALDDGDDNSPQAPGLGNSLHFNYPEAVTETKYKYLGSEKKDGVDYNKYVHYVANATTGIAPNASTQELLSQVYMDQNVTLCENDAHKGKNCLVLADGETHYQGSWELIINAVGFQSEGIGSIEEAIELWYDNGKDLSDYIWS